MATQLDVALLGAPQIRVGGEDLRVDTRKAVALLAYLAVEGTAPTRDQIVELLWPESEPERGRGVLRRTMSALRAGLGGGWLEASGDRMGISRDGLRIDLEEVSRLRRVDHGHGLDRGCTECIPDLTAAADLFRGDFMEGFAVRGSPEFEVWQSAQASGWRREHGTILDRLAMALASAGRYGEAIEVAQRRVALDPLHEPAHRLAMLLRAWSGDRSGAIDAYRACMAVLDAELGVSPLEETTELYEAILDEDLPPPPAPPRPTRPAAAVPIQAPQPLVGRASEWALLSESLARSATAGTVVAVLGEMGIGKTRLLDDFSAHVYSQGHIVVTGQGFAHEADVPYGVAVQLLRGVHQSEQAGPRVEDLPEWVRENVSILIPELGSPRELATHDPAAESRLLDAAVEVLVTVSNGLPGVVVIDDAHWIDPASARLLAHLSRRIDPHRMLVVLALREEDVPEDPQRADPLRAVLALADPQVQPGRLGVEDVEAMATAGVDVAAIHLRTGGLPLLVVEELTGGSTHGAARRALSARIDRLSALARQVLSAAAVAGGATDLDQLGAVSGRSENEVADAVDELLRRRVLREAPEGTVRFVHEPLRELVYEQTSLTRRRLLHRRAALGFEPISSSDARLVASTARHLRHAGMDAEAAMAHARAGELSRAIPAPAEAMDHYRTALGLGHPEPGSIHFALGELAMLDGDYGRALVELETAAARSAGGDVAMAEHRMGEVHRRLGHWDQAVDHFTRAEPAHPEPWALHADWALLSHRHSDHQAARAQAEQAQQAAQQAGSPAALARVANVMGVVVGDPAMAETQLRRSLELAGDDPVLRMAALNNLAALASRTGDVAAAVDAVAEALELGEQVGDRHRTAALHDRMADLLHQSGDPEGSRRHQREAARLFAEVGTEAGSWEPEVWFLSTW